MQKRFLLISLSLVLTLSGCGVGSFSTASKEEPSYDNYDNSKIILDNNGNINMEESSDIPSDSEPEYQTPDNINTPATLSKLESELDLIEIEATFLEDKLGGDLTTAQMNSTARELFVLWDDELNSLWNRFYEAADRETKDEKLKEQREWVNTKITASKEAGKKYAGGSLEGIVRVKKEAELTRLRCYDLAQYLGDITGEHVTKPSINIDGFYADTQGTMEAYSDLTIHRADDGFYEIEIGLYRLTTLTGYATLEEGILKFVDESMNQNIKGDIIVENESATFIITESDWEYLNVDEEFFFDEKWD